LAPDEFIGPLDTLPLVTTGHSRLKNGVASLAYDPVVHSEVQLSMDCRIKFTAGPATSGDSAFRA
jgi:hypothetical protein